MPRPSVSSRGGRSGPTSWGDAARGLWSSTDARPSRGAGTRRISCACRGSTASLSTPTARTTNSSSARRWTWRSDGEPPSYDGRARGGVCSRGSKLAAQIRVKWCQILPGVFLLFPSTVCFSHAPCLCTVLCLVFVSPPPVRLFSPLSRQRRIHRAQSCATPSGHPLLRRPPSRYSPDIHPQVPVCRQT